MGTQLKKHQVHLVATEWSTILLNGRSNKLTSYYGDYQGKSNILTPQYLYFTIDEEIKGGDWILGIETSPFSGQIVKASKDYHQRKDHWRKIVATTNPELWSEPNNCDGCQTGLPLVNGIHKDHQLMGIGCTANRYKKGVPPIDNPFIEAYIKAYNDGKPITEVMLETMFDKSKLCDCYYTKFCQSTMLPKGVYCRDTEYPETLKLKSNGSVIVHPVKERMYTHEEFRAAVRQAWIYSNGMQKFEDWFDKKYSI